MAFVKKTWKDRIVQYANRRLLTKSGGEVEQVTVTRDEGTISEAGDRFDAATMNDLENRVKTAFDGLNSAELPITSGSATNTTAYIDSGLSGKQDKSILNIVKTYGSGSSTDALDSIVAEYGTNNMMFAFSVPLGYFTGVMNFYSSSVGSGFLIQSATSRLWVLYYLNGAWTLTEKT